MQPEPESTADAAAKALLAEEDNAAEKSKAKQAQKADKDHNTTMNDVTGVGHQACAEGRVLLAAAASARAATSAVLHSSREFSKARHRRRSSWSSCSA